MTKLVLKKPVSLLNYKLYTLFNIYKKLKTYVVLSLLIIINISILCLSKIKCLKYQISLNKLLYNLKSYY